MAGNKISWYLSDTMEIERLRMGLLLLLFAEEGVEKNLNTVKAHTYCCNGEYQTYDQNGDIEWMILVLKSLVKHNGRQEH